MLLVKIEAERSQLDFQNIHRPFSSKDEKIVSAAWFMNWRALLFFLQNLTISGSKLCSACYNYCLKGDGCVISSVPVTEMHVCGRETQKEAQMLLAFL